MPRLLHPGEHMGAIKALRKIANQYNDPDPERGHSEADDILRGLLSAMGYKAIVEEYDKVAKWYA